MEQIYESDIYKKYRKLYNYYNKHPIKHIELIETLSGIKFYWYQKVMLLMICSKNGKTKVERRIQKAVKRYIK